MAFYPKTDRTRPRATCAGLESPITIAKFWRNRGGPAIVVTLLQFDGHPQIDVRSFITDAKGILQASHRGLTIPLAKLPDLSQAIRRAAAKAQELGLLKGGT